VFALGGCDLVWRVDSFGPPAPIVDADAATDSTIPPNLAFVSSMKIAPGSLGGLAGADALCNQLAVAGGLEGTYVAWLSSTSASARSRLEATNPRGWVRPDGKPFADTTDDIAHGRIWYPLRITDTMLDLASTGLDSELTVATGTGPDGLLTTGKDCVDFTSSTGVTFAGAADGGVFTWTEDSMLACTMPARIYCFGVSRSAPITLQPESNRIAFVTLNDLAPLGGRAAMDNACKMEAASAGFTGTFHAAIPTSADTALSRFTLGTPWVRTDHVTAIGADGTFQAPIVLDSQGQPAVSTTVWAGAIALDARPATAAETCGNWTAYSASAVKIGVADRSGLEAFGGLTANCNSAHRVYCLQDQ
jgi:hypothetical protein